MTYLENLRTNRIPSGRCSLCNKYVAVLERHHESYKPERTIYICHDHHFKAHFLPWQLPTHYKVKLLQVRHGFGVTITDAMVASYRAPGRQESKIKVKKKESVGSHLTLSFPEK